jgi:glutathione S-transferase
MPAALPPILLYDYPSSICSQMARLALVEKGVPFARRTVDIMETAEQFQPWYTALNPKAVVPTLAIGEEIVTDTIRIVHRVDRDFDGPPLTPADPEKAAAMEAIMADVMGLHYGVLLYSRRLAPDGTSPTVVARGHFLREQREQYPDRAEALDKRIAGNERLQKILADPAETAKHVDAARAVVGRIEQALAGRDFVGDDRYTLADTFATPALARFRMHGFEGWWSGGALPNVAAYYARMQARPSWVAAEVIDEGDERLL